MNVNKLIQMYLDDKRLAWAPTTLKSERYRLQGIVGFVTGDALVLWNALSQHGAYSRLTIWIRVTDMWQWALDEGHLSGGNPYRAFKKKNARLFKHVYEKKIPEITFDEAKARIAGIADAAIRRRATELLVSGLRWAESGRVEAGSVVGKGSKRRDVFVPEIEGPEFTGCYETFRLALKEVGLAPHDLRKIFLNRVVELGATEFDLRQIAGWSSIATASSYIKANSDRTKRLVEMVQNGGTDVTTEQIPNLLPRKQTAT